jgi:hypothetical protein
MKRFLLLITSTIIIFSCNKHDSEQEPGSEVKIGNYSNMITTRYDTLLRLHYDFAPCSLDIDNDRIFDFRIEYHSSWVTLPTTKYGFMSAQIICLDSNTYLSKVNTSDTTYIEHLSDTSSNGYKEFTTNYLCYKSSDKAVLYDVQQIEYPRTYYKEDVISMNSSWDSKGFVFMNIGDPVYSHYDDWYDRINNIVWIYYQNYYIECHFSLPYNQDFYFGFKKVKGNQIKVGWIKFRILPVDGKTLFISEAAIQQ